MTLYLFVSKLYDAWIFGLYSEVYIFFDFRKGLDTKLRLNVGFEDVSFALMPRPEV